MYIPAQDQEVIIDRAIDMFMEGYHCSEVTFRCVCEHIDPNFDPGLVRIATPFGGGIGDSQDLCGSATGCIMVIGYLYGRTSRKESQATCWKMSRECMDEFRRRLKSTSCSYFTWDGFSRQKCAGLVKAALVLLFEVLNKNDRDQAGQHTTGVADSSADPC